MKATSRGWLPSHHYYDLTTSPQSLHNFLTASAWLPLNLPMTSPHPPCCSSMDQHRHPTAPLQPPHASEAGKLPATLSWHPQPETGTHAENFLLCCFCDYLNCFVPWLFNFPLTNKPPPTSPFMVNIFWGLRNNSNLESWDFNTIMSHDSLSHFLHPICSFPPPRETGCTFHYSHWWLDSFFYFPSDFFSLACSQQGLMRVKASIRGISLSQIDILKAREINTQKF